MTGFWGCQVRYEIITRVPVAMEKPREGKDEGSCLRLIIESCDVFRKTTAAGTRPVHWTSVLEEEWTKSARLSVTVLVCDERETNKSFLCLDISHDLSAWALSLNSTLIPHREDYRTSVVRSSLRLALLDQWFSNLSAGWNHRLGSFRNYWCLGPPWRLWFNWSGCDCSFGNF